MTGFPQARHGPRRSGVFISKGSEAPKQGATEHRTCPLQHTSGSVLAQSWVLGKRGRAFSRYVDTTRFLGDLYYIRNLAAAIESSNGSRQP